MDARQRANKYAKLPDIERSAVAGKILFNQWFSYVVDRAKYEGLLKARKALRPEQIPVWLRDPDRSEVGTQVNMGGRGAGKTMSASMFFVTELLTRPGYRLEILGPTFAVSDGVCVKGRSGIKTIIHGFDPTLIQRMDDVKHELHLSNGSVVVCRSTEYPKAIEGPEYHGFWGDEVAEWHNVGGDECVYRKGVEPGVRLIGENGERTRQIITGTPEATDLIVELHEKAEERPDRYGWSQLSTRDNIANIDADKVEQMYEEGSEEFIQAKLDGELLLESPHALLSATDFAAARAALGELRWAGPEDMDETAMAVDASHADDPKSDECGIIVGGVLGDKAYVFADASLKGGPTAWGERIIEALKVFPEIDRVFVEDEGLVAEVVSRVLADGMEELGRIVKVVPVPHGNLSKKARADPVSVEYKLKRVIHAFCEREPKWKLGKYEQQWKSWNPKKRGTKVKSPDRVDAGVYLVTALLLRERAPETMWSPSEAMAASGQAALPPSGTVSAMPGTFREHTSGPSGPPPSSMTRRVRPTLD